MQEAQSAQIEKIRPPSSPSIGVPANESQPKWDGAKLKPTIGLFLMGLCLWFIPVPEGLTEQTWHLFAIFATTIAGIIVRPLPMGAVSIISVCICVVTGTLTMQQSLSSFSAPIIWLIVIALIIARGFVKTGLGERIAYYFISTFGKSTLGLSYSLVTTELLLSPAVPSNTARGAGIIFPVVKSLASGYGSDPEQGTSRKIGSYLVAVCFHSNIITSAMFLTAMACNPLIASLAVAAGAPIDWLTWAKLAVVPGLVSLFTMPLIIYRLYPPELKETPEAPAKAKQALAEKGPMTPKEMIMIGTFIMLLGLWVFGSNFGIGATTTALIGFGILLFTGVIQWQDVLDEKGAWQTLIWFSVLLMMAGMLTKMGMMDWFVGKMGGVVSNMGTLVTLITLSLIYFYIHYLFASVTSHVMSLFGAFLTLVIATGTSPLVGGMVLGLCSCLSASITHYGTGSAPVYYGGGYMTVKDWWKVGFSMSLAYFAVWGTIGAIWWKILGVW